MLLWVHPHASGDSELSPRTENVPSGSPPREWGQHGVLGQRLLKLRFTPTRVGTASSSSPNTCVITVHPHASGDSTGNPLKTAPVAGSPPREWGQLIPGPPGVRGGLDGGEGGGGVPDGGYESPDLAQGQVLGGVRPYGNRRDFLNKPGL